jgi:hypothetical protein
VWKQKKDPVKVSFKEIFGKKLEFRLKRISYQNKSKQMTAMTTKVRPITSTKDERPFPVSGTAAVKKIV